MCDVIKPNMIKRLCPIARQTKGFKCNSAQKNSLIQLQDSTLQLTFKNYHLPTCGVISKKITHNDLFKAVKTVFPNYISAHASTKITYCNRLNSAADTKTQPSCTKYKKFQKCETISLFSIAFSILKKTNIFSKKYYLH